MAVMVMISLAVLIGARAWAAADRGRPPTVQVAPSAGQIPIVVENTTSPLPTGNPGPLPKTGERLAPLIGTALALVGGGIVALFLGRRRRRPRRVVTL
jgi:hypothetical protein